MPTIRLATLEDQQSLLELVRAFPTPTPITAELYADMLQRKLADPCAYLALAVSDNTLVGYISGHRHAAFYAAGETAWVDEVLVLDRVRRAGVGRMLMVAFEAWATEAGCKLTALATAGAADFYQTLGYSTKAGYFKKYLVLTNV